jgi:hypothetical protein
MTAAMADKKNINNRIPVNVLAHIRSALANAHARLSTEINAHIPETLSNI